jgi:hypothetical protein
MPAMPGVRRAPQETWELPLKLLYVDDLTGREDPRPVEDRKPMTLDTETFSKRMRENRLAPPAHVKDTILERWSWLERIAHGIAPHANVKLEILNASKEDVLSDYEDSPEIPKCGLFKTLYSGEYGGAGGRPYGAVLLGHSFDASRRDLALLRLIVETAARAHLPLILRPNADLTASDALRALRATESGRYLGFGEPAIAGPLVAERFARTGFGGGVDGIEPLLWVAARVAHCLKIRHRYWMPNMNDIPSGIAFHNEWLATLAADPDDGVRPFRQANLRGAGDDRFHALVELSLHAWGGDGSPAGEVVIQGRLDKE